MFGSQFSYCLTHKPLWKWHTHIHFLERVFDWDRSDECDFDPPRIQQLVASIHPHNPLCDVICCMFGMMCLLLTRQDEEKEITTDWQIYKNAFFPFRFYCAILLLLFSPHRNHQTIELSMCGVDNTSWQMFALFHVANGNANEYVRIQIDKLTGWLWRLKTDFRRLEKLQTIFCDSLPLLFRTVAKKITIQQYSIHRHDGNAIPFSFAVSFCYIFDHLYLMREICLTNTIESWLNVYDKR